MKEITICGIGAITALGNTAEEIWEKLEKNEIEKTDASQYQFKSGMSLSQKRRSNRYSDMCVYVSQEAVKNAGSEDVLRDKNRAGTIFTTGFGPLNTVYEYAVSLFKEGYEYSSPIVFSNSVNNACVGNICMALGVKGASAMFMDSNNFLYSQMLLNVDKADCIITGAVEEYSEVLWESIKERNADLNLKEAAVAFLVRKSKECENAYCNVLELKTLSMGSTPLQGQISQKAEKNIRRLMEDISKTHKIDVCFASTGSIAFDETEINALQNAFGEEVPVVKDVKAIFGETMGASFNLNMMVAALVLKEGKLPKIFDVCKENIETVLVTGYGPTGNYMVAVLSKF